MLVVKSRNKCNALAFTLDVVITPFPLVTRGFDGEVSIRRVFLGYHCFSGGQGHQDDDDERNDGPSDFNFDRFVERCWLVTHRFAVFPDGIEHHTENSHKNNCANNQHEPVQPALFLGDLGRTRLQIELPIGRAARKVVYCPSRCTRPGGNEQQSRSQLLEKIVLHHF